MPPKKKKRASTQADTDEQILSVVQDLFILEALKGGMKVEDVRRTLRLDKGRVTKISKALKQPKSKPAK